MFDIGFQELIMVFIVSLFVVDPKKLPELSGKLGKWTNVIRGGMNEVKTHIEEEFKGIGLKGDDDARNLIKKVESAAYSQSADSPKDKITEQKGGA